MILRKNWIVDRVNESFDFYYGLLDDNEKRIYEKLCYAYLNLSESVTIPSIDEEVIEKVYNLTLIDNPVFFYVDKASLYCYSYYAECFITYTAGVDSINESIDIIDRALRRFSRKCEGKNNLEKEMIVHNTIVCQIDYQNDNSDLIHKANSIFIQRKAVCDGISLGAKMLLDHVGVNTIVVYDYNANNRDGHAWNMVFVNNGFYHVDYTYDNNLTKAGGREFFDYYNLTDNQISKDHDISELSLKSATKIADYHSMKGIAFSKRDVLKRYISSCIKNNAQFVYFRCVNELHELINIDLIRSILNESAFSGEYVIYHNDAQRVYCLKLD